VTKYFLVPRKIVAVIIISGFQKRCNSGDKKRLVKFFSIVLFLPEMENFVFQIQSFVLMILSET
jgi:hypothetical protein